MTLTAIITWVALFGIGFYAGLSFTKQKEQAKIKLLKKQIRELQNPEK